ncbi:MAG: YjbH domain-containing protein [Propionivibrio sp.]
MLAFEARAQLEPEPTFDNYSDMGGVGLMQMPTGRFAPEGEFAVSVTHTNPYLRNALSMQPLPGVEVVLRYTTIQDRLYGPENFSGNQTYKDKGVDVKLMLVKESSTWPQVAIGSRDVAGTGLFSGEYLVASRRYFNFDFSLGLGWGYLGSRGQIKNPLASLFSSFKTRENNLGQGGTISNQYFHGDRVSVIGGVTYQTPINGLTLKLELDGNDYVNDPSGKPIKASAPINLGVTYSYDKWLDLSLGVERGNAAVIQLAIHGNLHKGTGLPKLDPAPEVLKPRDLSEAIAISKAKGWEAGNQPELALANALFAKGYKVDSAEIRGREAIVEASQSTYRNSARAIGRAARIMANNVPPQVDELTYVNLENGLETQRVSLMRKDLEKAVNYEGSPEEIAQHLRVGGPASDPMAKPVAIPDRYPSFSSSWSPAMKQQIGGPDGAYFYQFLVRGNAELQLTRHWSATVGAILNIADNLAALKLPSDSVLPHVRSDINDYLKEGKTSLSQFQADYLTNLGRDWYGRASVGIFEEMFGGVSGEILHRPYDKRWAVGLEINRVQQRAYDQRFDFLDYKVTTGHLDLYYRLPFYNMTAQVSVGQYLAGDRGATFALSRQFDSGVVIGAFVTKTNVPASQFGEGSYDKGIGISIPMDMLSLYSSRGNMGVVYRPLTRDGGQRVNIAKRLYPMVANSNTDKLMNDWGQVLE